MHNIIATATTTNTKIELTFVDGVVFPYLKITGSYYSYEESQEEFIIKNDLVLVFDLSFDGAWVHAHNQFNELKDINETQENI